MIALMAATTLETVSYVLIGAGAAMIVAAIIIFIVTRAKYKSRGETAGKVKIKDGVRYTADERIVSADGVNVTHNEGDIILERGKAYKVEKNGALMPGKYSALTSGESEPTFKMRLGGYVRDVNHGDVVILVEGDTVTAVSHTVVLR